MMTMETEQRHLQMLLTVSSFGESLRRLHQPAEAFFKGQFPWRHSLQSIQDSFVSFFLTV